MANGVKEEVERGWLCGGRFFPGRFRMILRGIGSVNIRELPSGTGDLRLYFGFGLDGRLIESLNRFWVLSSLDCQFPSVRFPR